MSAKNRRANSPAFFEYPRFRTEMISESLTIPATTVHFTSSIWRKKSATYGMKSSRGDVPRKPQNT
jgi:hypothetical protein